MLHEVRSIKMFTYVIIVSRFPNETTWLYVCRRQQRHIYTPMERRGKGLAARETERERVCERQRVAENGVGVRYKNGRWKKN